MDVVGLVLLVAGLSVLVVAVVSLRRLRGEVARFEEHAAEVAERLDALPPELARRFAKLAERSSDTAGTGSKHIIAVELLNLFELAHRESALTRPFTVLTPRLLRDVVHRRLVSKIRESLTAAGVEADVRLHRAR